MLIYGQGNNAIIQKLVFTIQLENINWHHRLQYEERNQQRKEWLQKRKDQLWNEKLKRDSKIELDIQYIIDSTKIDKKPLDIDEINDEKAKRLRASQIEYDDNLKKAKEKAKIEYYHPPKSDFMYTVTIFDNRISRNVWVDVFIDTENGLEPFQTTFQEHKTERFYKIKDGSLELHFATKIPTDPDYRWKREKMNPPMGKKIIVFIANTDTHN